MPKTVVRPWAGKPANETWERLHGPDELKRLHEGIKKSSQLALDGEKIKDSEGREYVIRVLENPITGWAETHLESMQVRTDKQYKFVAMDDDVEAATISLIKVNKETIRALSGEVDRGYTGCGLFSSLVEKVYDPYPRRTRIEMGVGNIENLLSIINSFDMKAYVNELQEHVQDKLNDITEKTQHVRKEYGRVDFCHNPDEKGDEKTLEYSEWQLLEKTIVEALEKGVKISPEVIKTGLLARTFSSSYHDFKLEPIRSKHTDDGSECFMVKITAVKW